MTVTTAEILCVGTEILIGDIVNTNAAFLSGRLAEMGIAQYRQSVVGDNPDRLEEAVRAALARCDLLILTGGLGPTYDDLTKEITARAIGLPCEADPDCMRQVEAFYRERKIPIHDADRRQAYLPRTGVAFPNRYGSAPGVGVRVPGADKLVVLLPGPPREMQPMFDEEVRPFLEQYTQGVIVSRNLNIIGIGEPALEEMLSPLMRSAANPSVAPYCSEGEVRLRISARDTDRDHAAAKCEAMMQRILQTPVGPYVYGVDTSLPEAVIDALVQRKLHIAAAESCTGGLLTAMLTAVPGASEVLDGSVVTYANRIKEQFAGVRTETLEACGAVSEKTAAEMCRGIQTTMCADVGVSITGLAGPGGGTPETPVGTVFVGVSYRGRTRTAELHLHGTREHIRTLSVKRALTLVLEEIRRDV